MSRSVCSQSIGLGSPDNLEPDCDTRAACCTRYPGKELLMRRTWQSVPTGNVLLTGHWQSASGQELLARWQRTDGEAFLTGCYRQGISGKQLMKGDT